MLAGATEQARATSFAGIPAESSSAAVCCVGEITSLHRNSASAQPRACPRLPARASVWRYCRLLPLTRRASGHGRCCGHICSATPLTPLLVRPAARHARHQFRLISLAVVRESGLEL